MFQNRTLTGGYPAQAKLSRAGSTIYILARLVLTDTELKGVCSMLKGKCPYCDCECIAELYKMKRCKRCPIEGRWCKCREPVKCRRCNSVFEKKDLKNG